MLHHAGMVEHVYAAMEESYRSGPARRGEAPSAMMNLANTFAQSRLMLSTILNTQFFGNFLSLLIPITGALLISEENSETPI